MSTSPALSVRVQALANPRRFESIARVAEPIAWLVAITTLAIGIYLSLFVAPADYQQGESVRIMYVHVPAAWMATGAYAFIVVASLVGFVMRHPLADLAAKSAALPGAAFTLLALITGALWGKPMWGAYWVWDARLTSVLILLFIYLGYLAIWNAVTPHARAARLAALTAMVGAVNLPIIKFSVDWWNTLHQPASILRADGPTIYGDMLNALWVMIVAYTALFAALVLTGLRAEIAQAGIRRKLMARASEAPPPSHSETQP